MQTKFKKKTTASPNITDMLRQLVQAVYRFVALLRRGAFGKFVGGGGRNSAR